MKLKLLNRLVGERLLASQDVHTRQREVRMVLEVRAGARARVHRPNNVLAASFAV